MTQTIPAPAQPAFNPMTGQMVAPTTKESKTVDYRINMVDKAGAVKAVGIVKLWKHYDEAQQQAIIAILATPDQIVEISPMEQEATTGVRSEF